MSVINTCLLTFLMFSLSDSYKLLLIFPLPSKSHATLGEGFVRHLLGAGHELTYVTRYPITDPLPGLRQINVTSKCTYFEHNILAGIKPGIQNLPFVTNMMTNIAVESVMDVAVQNILLDVQEEFDAVIAEWMFTELYAGFSTVYNCPMIWSSSLNPHSMVLSLIDQDLNPAYSAGQVESTNIPPLTFWGRVNELWMLLYFKFYKWRIADWEANTYKTTFRAAMEKRSRLLLPYHEVKYNASLLFGNSHVSTADSIPTPINYIPIGGYHINIPVQPLPENLQTLMDNATNGVIYFSMGSMLTSKCFTKRIKEGFREMLGTLNYTILWSLDEDLRNVSPNVHIIKYAPQQSILAHPNCILFITHGGILSIMETLHFGVPIIGIPIIADQFNNVNRAVANGYGLKVEFGSDTPRRLKDAIEILLGDPRYRIRTKEMSFIFHDRLVPPGLELVHWVEHVVRTKGAMHLRSLALHVPWYQKMYLDFAACIILCAVIVYGAVRYTVWYRNRDSHFKLKFN